MRFIINGILLLIAGGHLFGQPTSIARTKELILLGSRFEVTAVAQSETLAWAGINAAIAETKRIEKVISEWDSMSETSVINRFAGVKPVVVSEELYNLIFRSLKVSALTDGAFDISFAPLYNVWKINEKVLRVPTPDEIAGAKKLIGYKKIVMNPVNHSVYLPEKGMKIGLGGIGQGYIANACKRVMISIGIDAGLINVSGDILSWGLPPDGKPWRVGIADPKNKSNIISWLAIKDVSLVTSGNYEKYIVVDGKRYGHILDPRSGYPAEHVGSVSIICPDAELSDALATGIFVLGLDAGMNIINQLKGVDCIIIDENNGVHTSRNVILSDEKDAPSRKN